MLIGTGCFLARDFAVSLAKPGVSTEEIDAATHQWIVDQGTLVKGTVRGMARVDLVGSAGSGCGTVVWVGPG